MKINVGVHIKKMMSSYERFVLGGIQILCSIQRVASYEARTPQILGEHGNYGGIGGHSGRDSRSPSGNLAPQTAAS